MNTRVLASLLTARIVYAINWYVIAAIFTSMAADLNENVSSLGILTSSFYLGIAFFQIPAGILAARYGLKRAVVCGMALSSLSDLLIGFTGQFYLIALLRFAVGVGMALVFAPSLSLVVMYFAQGREGLGVGMLNGAFGIGAAIGLFGWAVISGLLGWRFGADLSGALGLASALLLQLAVPRDRGRQQFSVERARVMRIIFDRRLVLLGILLFGLTSSSLVGSFIVYYANRELGVPIGIAGLIGGVNMLLSLPASPVVGRLYDKLKSFRKIFVVAGAVNAVGLAVTSLSVWGAVVGAVLTGFGMGGGLTLGFIVARQRREEPTYQTIAVSWVNSASLVGGFVAPIFFTPLVVGLGYSAAWLLSGAYAMVMLVPVVWLRKATE